MILHWFFTDSHCLSTGFPLSFHRFFHCCHWFCMNFPLVFHWFPTGFPPVSYWFSTGFSLVFHWFFTGFPLVFTEGITIVVTTIMHCQ
ncbi:hypothetical protein F5880DRAFT_1316372 [Lentinula raphanica]|nr:hypothetical protein F5880DRAFT_1316372 [Lentinula raphanica]